VQIASSQLRLRKISAFLRERGLELKTFRAASTQELCAAWDDGREVSERRHHRCLGELCQEQSICGSRFKMPDRTAGAGDERSAGYGRDHPVATGGCAQEPANSRIPESSGPGGSMDGEGWVREHGRSRVPGTGINWGRRESREIRKTASQLLALQRSDGGWDTRPNWLPDACATGQALMALRQSAIMALDNAQYQRGLQHSFNHRLEDGSWMGRTRSPSFQPYFDSDFPHGHDQFIPAAATN